MPHGSATSLPPGFAITQVVTGLSLPVDMVFTPSGDILVAEKGQGDADGWASVRLVRNGILAPDPVITLSSTVINDSGIFGLALDPDFADNHHFYLWYATGSQAPNPPTTPVNRLVRLTLDPVTGIADPASYTVILDDVLHSEWHNGGGLIFGDDGTLFIATGDAVRDELAQDLSTLNGKVLRIRPTADGYTIPSDNPFVDVPGARPEIYAVGLRNPFRITKNALDGEIYLGDVGNKTWEELNRVTAGANYGWSEREGPCASGKREPCKAAEPRFTDPVLYYLHSDANNSGGAITGIAFYAGDAYPPEYQGSVFFADYDQRYLATGMISPAGFTIDPFFDGVDRVVDMEYFRNNIYFLDIRQGAIYMLFHSGSTNVAPTANLTVDVDKGAAPLTVTFAADGTVDPDDTALTYIWNPGDGSTEVETQEPIHQHLYTADGTYNAVLRVRDIRGAVSAPVQTPITVYSGTWPTIALDNLTDPARTLFHGGDRFRFAALREGGEADLDPETPFSWRIDLLHNEHAHPELVGFVATEGTLTISTENHGGDADIAYRLTLTMQTSEGQPVRVTRELYPAVVQVTIRSEPAGFGPLQIDNETQAFPYGFTAVTGTDYSITAPETLLAEESIWRFSEWATAVPTSTRRITYTVPISIQTVTAVYEFERAAAQNHLPLLPGTGN
ncbi:MAG: PQQ-dependent sugar dehydrogenase [Caldilineaceae bacterium]|nr:PQQ-dependent sugar dehydrogenase [Caldilineaceae bacterium]